MINMLMRFTYMKVSTLHKLIAQLNTLIVIWLSRSTIITTALFSFLNFQCCCWQTCCVNLPFADGYWTQCYIEVSFSRFVFEQFPFYFWPCLVSMINKLIVAGNNHVNHECLKDLDTKNWHALNRGSDSEVWLVNHCHESDYQLFLNVPEINDFGNNVIGVGNGCMRLSYVFRARKPLIWYVNVT